MYFHLIYLWNELDETWDLFKGDPTALEVINGGRTESGMLTLWEGDETLLDILELYSIFMLFGESLLLSNIFKSSITLLAIKIFILEYYKLEESSLYFLISFNQFLDFSLLQVIIEYTLK